MTATTVDTTNDPAIAARPSRRSGARFLIAFLAGVIAVLALGAGGLYAFDRQFEGRVLPGVRVGGVDLSGLAPADARSRIAAAYPDVASGELVLSAGSRRTVVSYADIDRRIDLDGLVDDALAAGRAGAGLERVIGNARTALQGVTIEPRVLFDADELARRIETAAGRADRDPKDASVTVTAEAITVHAGADGAAADREAPLAQALAALSRLDAQERIELDIPVAPVAPRLTTAEAQAGKAAADLIARDIDVAVSDEKFTIEAATIRSWLRVSPTVDGRLVPVLNVVAPRETVKAIAKDVKKNPVNATFLTSKSNKVVGVTAAKNGRALNQAATVDLLTDALRARSADNPAPIVEASVRTLKPTLSTEEAEQAAPLMKRISTWTTFFPISEKNHFGANIWIPALDIDGYVVGPGEWFDFWNAVGPVTRARGYGDGGAIINGRTEPQGALAGGICSCSTTLFNAALRAGFQMGARRNHYYYIDRYPIGLDATVFKSGSSVQTMSWRNDTKYPVLIRGFKIKDGSAGYVRFDLYSVPTGRKVSFSKPIVKNVRPAADRVQPTTALKAGTSRRVEYPVAGKDVWVTRVVRDKSGNVVHKETYYSHYSRVDGVVLVGRG
jgi:vancomycin resistance protein YoaR